MIEEKAHSQAITILNAERQELLLCRERIQALTNALKEGGELNAQLQARIAELESPALAGQDVAIEFVVKAEEPDHTEGKGSEAMRESIASQIEGQ